MTINDKLMSLQKTVLKEPISRVTKALNRNVIGYEMLSFSLNKLTEITGLHIYHHHHHHLITYLYLPLRNRMFPL
jgi:hypothetical protein